MKIMVFSTNYLPHIGGAELAIKEVTDRLQKHDFTIVTARLESSRPYFEKIGNVKVHRIGVGHRIDVFLLALFGWVKALYLQADKGFDMAWSMMASQGSIAAALFRFLSRKPLVLTLQEGNDEEHLKRYVGGSDLLYKVLIRPFHYLVFKAADHITAISSHLKERAERVSPDTPVSVIPNGVDLEEFSKDFDPEKISDLRSEYVKENETLITTTSRLAPKNAVGDLIESLTHLPESYRLVILGDGALRSKLERQVSKKGLDDRVYMIGSVDFQRVPKFLAAADIFCRPSLSEGMGNSFIEAMAAKLPVVATPVGGITDFLEDEKTGLFANVSDPESIARQIKRLTEDEELRTSVVENAYKLVVEKYNWDTIAEDYNELFTEIAQT